MQLHHTNILKNMSEHQISKNMPEKLKIIWPYGHAIIQLSYATVWCL